MTNLSVYLKIEIGKIDLMDWPCQFLQSLPGWVSPSHVVSSSLVARRVSSDYSHVSSPSVTWGPLHLLKWCWSVCKMERGNKFMSKSSTALIWFRFSESSIWYIKSLVMLCSDVSQRIPRQASTESLKWYAGLLTKYPVCHCSAIPMCSTQRFSWLLTLEGQTMLQNSWHAPIQN